MPPLTNAHPIFEIDGKPTLNGQNGDVVVGSFLHSHFGRCTKMVEQNDPTHVWATWSFYLSIQNTICPNNTCKGALARPDASHNETTCLLVVGTSFEHVLLGIGCPSWREAPLGASPPL